MCNMSDTQTNITFTKLFVIYTLFITLHTIVDCVTLEECKSQEVWYKHASVPNAVMIMDEWLTVNTFMKCAEVCCSTEGMVVY